MCSEYMLIGLKFLGDGEHLLCDNHNISLTTSRLICRNTGASSLVLSPRITAHKVTSAVHEKKNGERWKWIGNGIMGNRRTTLRIWFRIPRSGRRSRMFLFDVETRIIYSSPLKWLILSNIEIVTWYRKVHESLYKSVEECLADAGYGPEPHLLNPYPLATISRKDNCLLRIYLSSMFRVS